MKSLRFVAFSTVLSLLSAWGAAPDPVPDLPAAVVYEANLRALAPNVGFDGLRARLPQIKTLGVNVLWLMPVQPVGKVRSAGGLGSPYAVADFNGFNAEFGDEARFRRLVAAAHKLKMAVILDWVGDHTAWDCSWIEDHPDWYLHTASGAISIPAGTGWNDVAALDYKNRTMRAAMVRSMARWVSEFAIDGFRCDAADRIPIDFWRDAIATLRKATSKRLLMLAEGFRAEDYAAGFDLTYGWDFCSKLREVFKGGPATEIAKSAAFEARGIPVGARRLRFVTNHDISAWEGSTLEFYKTPDGLRTAFTIAALYGGTPLIYAGQEVDWDKRIPIFDESAIDWKRSPETIRWLGRLIALRQATPAFLVGELTDFSTFDVVAFSRAKGGDQAIVLANVRNQAVIATIPSDLRGRWKDGLSGADISIDSQVRLAPYGRAVFVRTVAGS